MASGGAFLLIWVLSAIFCAGVGMWIAGQKNRDAWEGALLGFFLGPIGWGIAGLGMGFAYITLNLTMLELAEPGQEGNASSSMQLASVLGSGVGTGIGGALVAVVHAQGNPIQHALGLHFGLMLFAVLVGFFTARGLPQFTRPPANPRFAAEAA